MDPRAQVNFSSGLEMANIKDLNQYLRSLINQQEDTSINMSETRQNICSSLSSSSSSEGGGDIQFSPPFVNDIVTETTTFEHTEDFILSLKIPLEILDDLASRFLLNMPQEEKYDPIRICFQMENAYWHYLDFCCEYDSSLPKFKFKRFAQIMFTYVPRLRQFLDVFDDIINKWIKYKFSIPCSGAIMMDESLDYVLLVQGYGSKTWGFPKGKVNHDESLMNCAIREVFEETGYNCMGNIYENQFLDRKIFESRLRLYLIKNVNINFEFKPQARNEIRSIKWFALKDFPTTKNMNANLIKQNGNNVDDQIRQNFSKFISVMPFIPAIRKWSENEKRSAKILKKRERRHQKKLAKQQMQQISILSPSESISTKLRNMLNEQKSSSNLNSNSSSPSTVEELENSLDVSANFVDADLKEILGFREMYNVDNDKRDLAPRNDTSFFGGGTGENFLKIFPTLIPPFGFPLRETPLPKQVDTLEMIEQAMLNDVETTKKQDEQKQLNENIGNDINSVLGSKGSCDKKLNLLFGLAQNSNNNNGNQSPLINQLISSNTATMPIPIKSNTKCATKNDQKDLLPKPNLAPIGTKRVSLINFSNDENNQFKVNDNQQQKTSSGHAVISNKSSTFNNSSSKSIINSSNSNNNNNKRITSPKKVTILQKPQHQQQKQEKISRQNQNNDSLDKQALLKTIFNTEINCVNDTMKNVNNKCYNGLEDETVKMLHPKIELLMQRLSVINNTAA